MLLFSTGRLISLCYYFNLSYIIELIIELVNLVEGRKIIHKFVFMM